MFETVRQRHSLTKSKPQAFARDGIDRARSIADQCDIFFPDALQLAIGRECAPFGGSGLSPAQPRLGFGKLGQRLLQASSGSEEATATQTCSWLTAVAYA